MTKCLGLNSNNDIYLGADGNIVLQSGADAVGTACLTISKSQLGEMVLSSTQGIPYFETVFNGIPNLRIWKSYLISMLQNVDGVIQVTDLSLINNNNILNYTATIETQFGLTAISG